MSFQGIKGVKLEYYTNVAGWKTVPGGLFNDSATFDIPSAHRATFGLTTIRVVKGGMHYTKAFTLAQMKSQPVHYVNVPVRTIRVYGIDASCKLAVVQSDWVYSYAPAIVGGMNYFKVFGNGRAYEVRLYRDGFNPICRKGFSVSVPNAAGYTDVNFGQSYFYAVYVPAGVTDLRMQSYNWIHNKKGSADTQIILLRDVGKERTGKMSFVYNGVAYTDKVFPLDGTNPFVPILGSQRTIAKPQSNNAQR